jgi:hypothetical protein
MVESSTSTFANGRGEVRAMADLSIDASPNVEGISRRLLNRQ